jgi:hypothetical protein
VNLESGADVESSSEPAGATRPTQPSEWAATPPRRRDAPCAASPSRPSGRTGSAGERRRTRCPVSRLTPHRPCARGARSATHPSTRPVPTPLRQVSHRCDRRARGPRSRRRGADTRAPPPPRLRPRRPTRAVQRARARSRGPHLRRTRSAPVRARCRLRRRQLRRQLLGRPLPVPRLPGPRSSDPPRPPRRRARTRPRPHRPRVPRRSARRPRRPRPSRRPRGRAVSSRGRARGVANRAQVLRDPLPETRAHPRPGRGGGRGTAPPPPLRHSARIDAATGTVRTASRMAAHVRAYRAFVGAVRGGFRRRRPDTRFTSGLPGTRRRVVGGRRSRRSRARGRARRRGARPALGFARRGELARDPA